VLDAQVFLIAVKNADALEGKGAQGKVDKHGNVLVKPDFGEHATAAVDVWSIGVIYYIMLCGEFPFEGKNQVKSIIAGKYKTGSQWEQLSERSKAFARKCLTVDYTSRPPADDLMYDELFSGDDLPRDDLQNLDRLRRYMAVRRNRAVGTSAKAVIRMHNLGKVQMATNTTADQQALDLFREIDSMGNRNGEVEQVELFEIILYMKEKGQHFFERLCPITGAKITDEARLRQFADNIRGEMDLDKNGTISQEEFVRGYCIWAMHWAKQDRRSALHHQTSDVYQQTRSREGSREPSPTPREI